MRTVVFHSKFIHLVLQNRMCSKNWSFLFPIHSLIDRPLVQFSIVLFLPKVSYSWILLLLLLLQILTYLLLGKGRSR